MGKIRINLFRSTATDHDHEIAEPLAPKKAQLPAQLEDDRALELEGLPSYPTQPITTQLEQLPFIAAEEVVKRDGTRGSDVCTTNPDHSTEQFRN